MLRAGSGATGFSISAWTQATLASAVSSGVHIPLTCDQRDRRRGTFQASKQVLLRHTRQQGAFSKHVAGPEYLL